MIDLTDAKPGDLLTFRWDDGTEQTAPILHTEPHFVHGHAEICMDWAGNGLPVWSEVRRVVRWEKKR